MFFFGKKNQKTFTYGVWCRRGAHQVAKGFGFFSSKRTIS